jgi:YHS domain-containing protein
MKTLKLLPLCLLITGLFTAAVHADPINDKCPVSGKAVDETKTVAVSVGFCCEKCKAKFDEAPGKHLAKAAKAEEGKCVMNGKTADAEQTSTITIAVCCGNCQGKVKEDPKKYLADTKAK